ncbi:hypothetical protein ATO13_08556 [Stappia sp. 22II-S9-Z10]|nr:hypothetical protein ATO13_08556 [Stappia sp. 22II-S9-Z10]
MTGITLDIAAQRLAAWLEADAAVAQNQSYTITTADGSRSLTRANVAEIRRQIDYWQGHVTRLTPRTRRRTRYFVPGS